MRVSVVMLFAVALGAQTATSIWDGIYTPEQASQGQDLYQKQCASCHGDDLGGQGPAPSLAGSDFMANWNGQTLGDLFDKVQVSMPADHPGSLTGEQNAAILAFILKSNKVPAGKASLATASDVLKQIRFEAAKEKK